MKTLVTGGIRSGKSAYAETLLGTTPTMYVATGGTRDDDPSWVRRVDAHRRRRPATWTTVETRDVPEALPRADADRRAVLLDDVGGWLTGTLDTLAAWDQPADTWRSDFSTSVDALCGAVSDFRGDIVVVTGEVGYGLVSPYPSGRLFTDELGTLNQRLAGVAERVVLVACGCPLVLKDAGRSS